MGMRRLFVLIAGMPEDAAVWRPDRPQWTQEHEFQATLIEMVDAWGRTGVITQIRLHGDPKKTQEAINALGEPVRIRHPERPGNQPEKKKPTVTTDPREIEAFFRRHVNRKG